MNLKELLRYKGYNIKEYSNYFTTQGLWRNGTDIGSIAVYEKDNIVKDFVTGETFTIDLLIKRVSGNEKIDIDTNFIELNNEPEIDQIKVFSKELLKNLLPIHDYWEKRGINNEVLRKLKSGLSSSGGKMKNRYVFPIFNNKNEILAFNGRDVTGNNKVKWLFMGPKNKIVYPAFLNSEEIKNKNCVILVESVGDLLSLMTCGITNVIVLFGVEISYSIINYLLKLNIDTIVISTNNDEKTNNAGNDGARKIYSRLSKYFNKRQIKILLPPEKDWNEILINQGKEKIFSFFKDI